MTVPPNKPSSPKMARVIFPKGASAQDIADALNQLRAQHGFSSTVPTNPVTKTDDGAVDGTNRHLGK